MYEGGMAPEFYVEGRGKVWETYDNNKSQKYNPGLIKVKGSSSIRD